MTATGLSLLALTAACALPILPAQLVAGCGMRGCDVGNSFATALHPPSISAGSGREGVSVLWSHHTPRTRSCANVRSVGCITQLEYLSCAVPLTCNASGYWSGLVGLNSSGGVTYSYDGAGTGHCQADTSAGGVGANMGIMDIFGDVAAWDTSSVMLLEGDTGSAAWEKSIFPPAYCPDVLSSVTLSNSTRLMYYIATPGEVFGYYGNGVPLAMVVLYANDTTSNAGEGVEAEEIATPEEEQKEVKEVKEEETAGAWAQRTRDAMWPFSLAATESVDSSGVEDEQPTPASSSPLSLYPAQGVLIPIAEQATDQVRVIYVARYFKGNMTPPDRSSGGSVNSTWRPSLTPTSSLRVAAVDPRTGVPRILMPYQLDLPLPEELKACLPQPNGAFPGREPVAIAGPIVVSGGRVVIAAMCVGSPAVEGKEEEGEGNREGKREVAPTTTTVYLMGIAIQAPQKVVPSVLWTSNLTLPFQTASKLESFGLALDVSSSASAPSLFFTAGGGANIAKISAANGALTDTTNISAVLAAANATTCALAPLFASGGRYTGFALTNHPLVGEVSKGASSSLLILSGSVLPAPALGSPGAYWILALEAPNTIAWCMPTPAQGGQERIGKEGRTRLRAGEEAPAQPGQYPVQGQISIASRPSSAEYNVAAGTGDILVVVTEDGVYGIGGK